MAHAAWRATQVTLSTSLQSSVSATCSIFDYHLHPLSNRFADSTVFIAAWGIDLRDNSNTWDRTGSTPGAATLIRSSTTTHDLHLTYDIGIVVNTREDPSGKRFDDLKAISPTIIQKEL